MVEQVLNALIDQGCHWCGCGIRVYHQCNYFKPSTGDYNSEVLIGCRKGKQIDYLNEMPCYESIFTIINVDDDE